MRTKKPSGNAFVNQAKLQQTQTQAPTQKAAATSPAQTAKPATKAQQDQGGFSKAQGPADKPSINYGQTGGSSPFTSGPMIAVNPMIEPKPTPVEPAINPLPDTVQAEPAPQPAINPFPEPPPPVQPAINPLPDTTASEPLPGLGGGPAIGITPPGGPTSLNFAAERATEIARQEMPFPAVLSNMKALLKDIPELWPNGAPDDAALTQTAERLLTFGEQSAGERLLALVDDAQGHVGPAINPLPDTRLPGLGGGPAIGITPPGGPTSLNFAAERATEIAQQELPYGLVLNNMKNLIKDIPELWQRMVGEPDDATLTQVAESFLKFGDTSAGERLLQMAALE